MYKTDINKINISSTNFIDTEKLNDLSIGEDNSELLVVNSNAIFTGTLTVNDELVSGGSGGGSSGIVNNRIDGDLTIGEDSSDLMVINSEAKFVNNVNIGTEIATVENIMINNISRAIPVKPVSGDAGKVLKANAAGTGLEYGTINTDFEAISSNKIIYNNLTGNENLYYWSGKNSFSFSTEPFVGNSFTRITRHNLNPDINMTYSVSNIWHYSYMFQLKATIDTRPPSAFSTSWKYIKLSMPVKPGVSNSFFVKAITGDRWTSHVVYVNNENGSSNYYRLEPRTNDTRTTNGVSSWIGPNAEPPINDNGYHEWVQFYIPQYIIDDYCYTTTDNKSKYRKNINIYMIQGYGAHNGETYISGLAMRENPIDLVICNGIVLHWYISGGTSVTLDSSNWNDETLIEFVSGTQSNILIPIPNKKNPITNGYPSFILGTISHKNYETYIVNRKYIYLENNSNTSDTMNLGKFTRSNIGTFGLFVKERHKHPLGAIVPKLPYNSPYVVVVQHRPYIRIKITGLNTFYSRGFYTELLDYTDKHVNMFTDGEVPIVYT